MARPNPFDPALFRPEAIAPEMQAFNTMLAEQMKSLPGIETQGAAVVRENMRKGAGMAPPPVFSARAETRTIGGPGGEIPLRIIRAKNPRGVFLHIHGGGWVIGAADLQDPALERFADSCNVTVVSVEYRLAPENPYPAGPDDCEAAARWVVANAASELGSDRLVIGGESAGAHLSAVTLLRMRDRHGYTGFRAANLVFGLYDMSHTPSVRSWAQNLILSPANLKWFTDCFVPVEKRREPDVSPLYAELSGLPPALFTVGTLDPLVDDSLFMYGRWTGAGNEAELAIYPGGVHGFTGLPIPLGEAARTRMEAFLNAALD